MSYGLVKERYDNGCKEGARGAEEQGWQARRNGHATFHSVCGPSPKGVRAEAHSCKALC